MSLYPAAVAAVMKAAGAWVVALGNARPPRHAGSTAWSQCCYVMAGRLRIVAAAVWSPSSKRSVLSFITCGSRVRRRWMMRETDAQDRSRNIATCGSSIAVMSYTC
jgi:hypothetical protein